MEVLKADRKVLNWTADGGGKNACHLGKCHQARTGDFVPFAQMPVFGQCRNDHIGDIINVDDRLRRIAAGMGSTPPRIGRAGILLRSFERTKPNGRW